MAQSSNAQRDPSMEEILASIRKIIEEGEESAPRIPTRDLNDIPAMGPAANDVARAQLRAEAAPLVELELPPAPAPRPSTSRSGVDLVAEFRRGRDVPPAPAPEPAPAPVVEPALDAATLAALEAATASLTTEHDPDLRIEDFEMELEEAVSQTMMPATQGRGGSILSEAVGRQVTASFSELTDALASRQRPLELVAEDVLRPMLQDWLDNNLPTLVEKLVREEIERVARGG